MNKIKKFLFIILISFITVLSFTKPVYGLKLSEEESLFGDFVNTVFDIDLTNGKGLLDSDESVKERSELNKLIAQDRYSGKTSLFNRFGGQLKFIPYFGEKSFDIGFIDEIYKGLKNEGEFKFNLFHLFDKKKDFLNTQVYTNRPYILTDDELKSGMVDPRTDHYSAMSVTGGSSNVGNFYLIISEFIIDVITFFIDGTIFIKLSEVFDMLLESSAWTYFSGVIKWVLPFAIIGVIIKFAKQAMDYAKQGNQAKEGLLTTILNFVLGLMIIYTFIINPAGMNKVVREVVTLTDNIFSSTLNSALEDDEVIHSDDGKNVIKATIWKTAVLEPWSLGMFGHRYEEMYTQYESNENKVKFDQSHDNVKEDFSGIRYSSKEVTGDVTVPIGGGNLVRNWAALAWSTQSIYHIDAIGGTDTTIGEWPHAITTYRNNKMYIDNFRWLDAKLNISPEFKSGGEQTNNYTNSRPYTEDFISQGMNSLFLAFLALLMIPTIFKKLTYLIFTLVIAIRWIGTSIIAFIRPDGLTKHFGGELAKSLTSIKLYFWYSFILYLLIVMYSMLVGQGFLQNLAWIFLSIMLSQAECPNMNTFRRMKENIKGKISDVKDKFSGDMEDLNSNMKQQRKLKKEISGTEHAQTGLKDTKI